MTVRVTERSIGEEVSMDSVEGTVSHERRRSLLLVILLGGAVVAGLPVARLTRLWAPRTALGRSGTPTGVDGPVEALRGYWECFARHDFRGAYRAMAYESRKIMPEQEYVRRARWSVSHMVQPLEVRNFRIVRRGPGIIGIEYTMVQRIWPEGAVWHRSHGDPTARTGLCTINLASSAVYEHGRWLIWRGSPEENKPPAANADGSLRPDVGIGPAGRTPRR